MKEKIVEYIKYNKVSAAKIGLVSLLILAGIFISAGKTSSEEITVESSLPSEGAETPSEAGIEAVTTIYVDIAGAVQTPGVLKVEADTRVYQAIEMSGGLNEKADVTNINMAAKLRDEDKIYIPEIDEKLPSANDPYYQAPSGATGIRGNLININKATSDELQDLTGVGPSTAEKIISYRNEFGPFQSIEDIKNVSGIGDKSFAKFKDNICI